MEDRLETIRAAIEAAILAYLPDAMAVEEFHRIGSDDKAYNRSAVAVGMGTAAVLFGCCGLEVELVRAGDWHRRLRIPAGATREQRKPTVDRWVRAIVRDCPLRMSDHAADAVAIAVASRLATRHGVVARA